MSVRVIYNVSNNDFNIINFINILCPFDNTLPDGKAKFASDISKKITDDLSNHGHQNQYTFLLFVVPEISHIDELQRAGILFRGLIPFESIQTSEQILAQAEQELIGAQQKQRVTIIARPNL